MDDFNALIKSVKIGLEFFNGDSLVKKDIKDGDLIQILPDVKFKKY